MINGEEVGPGSSVRLVGWVVVTVVGLRDVYNEILRF